MQLSVRIAKRTRECVSFFGGDNRTRICDLSRVRRALYRLSYASIWKRLEKVVTRTGLEPVLPP